MTNSATEILSRGLPTISMYSIEYYLNLWKIERLCHYMVKNYDAVKRQRNQLIYSVEACKGVNGDGIALKRYIEGAQSFQVGLISAM